MPHVVSLILLLKINLYIFKKISFNEKPKRFTRMATEIALVLMLLLFGGHTSFCILLVAIIIMIGGARGVMVIVAGYGHGDTSSNPGPD